MQALAIRIAVIGLVLGGLTLKIYMLSNEVDNDNIQMASYVKQLGAKDNTITVLQGNAKELSDKIDQLSIAYAKYKTTAAVAKHQLEVWKSKPAEIRYKTITTVAKQGVDYSKGTCTEGLELNKAISELKYADL